MITVINKKTGEHVSFIGDMHVLVKLLHVLGENHSKIISNYSSKNISLYHVFDEEGELSFVVSLSENST